MTIEGFSLRYDGPQSGLTWVTFSNIVVTGKKGTPEYEKGMRSKAKLIDKVIGTELRLGTRHFNKAGKQLKSLRDILFSYANERGVYAEIKADRRWKLEGLAKNEGIRTDGHESSDQRGAGPAICDPGKPAQQAHL